MKPSVALVSMLFGLAALGAPGLAPAQDSTVPGHVVIAKASDDALVIWDSSPEIAAIVSDKVNDADANARLAHDCLRVLAQSLPKLDKSTKTVTIRVIYNKTGAVSPVYGSPTFAGVERYATLTAPYKDAVADKGHWRELGPNAKLPGWLQWKILGTLPPR